MRRSTAVVMSLLSLIVAQGCRSRPVTAVQPDDLIGTYAFERSGKNAGRNWSVRSILTLERANGYELETRIRTADESSDETETGSYRVERDRLVLRNKKDESIEFMIKGDSLVAKMGWPGRWFARRAGGVPAYVRLRSTELRCPR
jgi:hypothetical protein